MDKKKSRIAYGGTLALTKNDNVYKAVTGVSKASEAKLLKDESRGSQFNFIFPTIVLEGNLLECFTDNNNNMKLKEIKSGVYLIPTMKSVVFIQIVTIDVLSEFVQNAKNVSDNLLSLCKEYSKKYISKIIKNISVKN